MSEMPPTPSDEAESEEKATVLFEQPGDSEPKEVELTSAQVDEIADKVNEGGSLDKGEARE